MTDRVRFSSEPLTSGADVAPWDLASSVTSFEPTSVRDFEGSRLASSEQDGTAFSARLAALFGLLAVSRFAGLTHQSLWYDEGYTVSLASASSFHDFWVRFGHFTTSEHLQPLYYFFIFFWSRLAGVSDAALRVPSALFSIGSAIAACFAVNSLSGGRRNFVLLASAGLAVSSFSLYYAQEARPYALLQLLSFSLLATFLHYRAENSDRGPSLGRQLGFGAVCGLCFLGSPFTTLLVLCLAVSDLIVTRNWTSWIRSWIVPAAISLACFLAYLIPVLKTMPTFIARDVTAIRQPLWMNISYAIYGIVFGTTLQPAPSLLRGSQKLQAVLMHWPVILMAALTLLALASGVWLSIRNARRLNPQITVSILTLLLYVFLLFGFFGAVGHLNVLPRHSSALFALLFIVIAAVGSLVPESSSPRGNWLFAFGLTGWVVLNCVSVLGYYADPAFGKDDYRDTAVVLREYSTPAFVVAGQPQLLARYGAATSDATDADPGNLSQLIEARSGHAEDVLLVFNQFRNYRWAATSLVPADAMAPDYHCRNIKHLANIDIYACQYLASKRQDSKQESRGSETTLSPGVSFNGRTEDRSLGIMSPL